ncbi:MAG: hypothetical protein E7655_08320 [Ruminococcaceae bacterium]|nr:hypothetical protein [Oscillospiraceae bacterium]
MCMRKQERICPLLPARGRMNRKKTEKVIEIRPAHWYNKRKERKRGMYMIVNVIDIGSNTVKMSLFAVEEGRFVLAGKKSTLCRLIAYCTSEGLSEEGIAVLLKTIKEYQTESEKAGAEKTFVFATASLRRAANCESVIARVKSETGLTVDLISEQREALLSCRAVLDGTVRDPSASGATLDMGGGSTEIVLFEQGRPHFHVSMPFGCLSLFQRFVKGELATSEECEAIERAVEEHLLACGVPGQSAPMLYMAGGSARAAALAYRHAKGIACSDDNGFSFSPNALGEVLSFYQDKDPSVLKRLVEDRYNLLFPAAAAFRAIVRHLGSETVVVSAMGMREGYVYERIEKGEIR